MAETETKDQVLPMADSKTGEITKAVKKRQCPDCGGEHEFYIKACPLKSQTVILRQDNARLKARCEQLERKQRCFDTVVCILAETIKNQMAESEVK